MFDANMCSLECGEYATGKLESISTDCKLFGLVECGELIECRMIKIIGTFPAFVVFIAGQEVILDDNIDSDFYSCLITYKGE